MLKDNEVEIQSAELRLRYVQPSASVIGAHAHGLKTYNALYPHRSLSLGTFTILQGSLSHTHENLFPTLVVVVENTAFNGSLATNPFNFVHANLISVGVYVNGEAVPTRPSQFDFTGDCAKEYTTLRQQLGLYFQGRDLGFSMADYNGGYTILAYSLGSDGGVAPAVQLYKEKNVRLEMRFGTATAEVYDVIFGGVFDKQLQITELWDVVPETAWK